MHTITANIFVIFSACAYLFMCQSNALADQIQEGNYYRQGGGGLLVIKKHQSGSSYFSIETTGGNAHTCSLEGIATNWTANLPGLSSRDRCTIKFLKNKDGIEVLSDERESHTACRDFCGMRAMFNGLYIKPSHGCTTNERSKKRGQFDKLYRAKSYTQAASIIKDTIEHCSNIMDWLELDRARNDYAITLYHLGRKDECLTTLRLTRAYELSGVDELRESYPPTDFDNYVSIAKSTWHNTKICSQ